MYPSSTLKDILATKESNFEKVIVDFKETKIPFSHTILQDGKDITFKNHQYKEGATEGYGLNVGVPKDSIFDKGTILSLSFPKGIPIELYDVRVVVDYEASALRFYKNDVFFYDNYYNGRPWTLSTSLLLKDYKPSTDLTLKFIPLQPNDPIYIGGTYWRDLNKTENTLSINSLKAIPVYNRILNLKDSDL